MKHVRVKLTFPEAMITQPILGRMVKEFDVMPNIRRANVEEKVGWIVCEIGGDDEAVEQALHWLEGLGIQVDDLGNVIDG